MEQGSNDQISQESGLNPELERSEGSPSWDKYQKDKEFVPALNIDLLPVDKYVKEEEDKACCICQEDFCEEQEVITLLPCKHQFHNKSEECLEGGSVLTWLEKYNYCPMCKAKVNALGYL